jgi:hypothetical protein
LVLDRALKVVFGKSGGHDFRFRQGAGDGIVEARDGRQQQGAQCSFQEGMIPEKYAIHNVRVFIPR